MRGLCSVCSEFVRLRSNGTLASHSVPRPDPSTMKPFAGGWGFMGLDGKMYYAYKDGRACPGMARRPWREAIVEQSRD